ncbi:MAG TPA: hypothetical protein VMZ30_15765 [Pyrinomonadaceae bacterium]|nr:hypothetical protein [Pyrinomonadaceae bacterium]
MLTANIPIGEEAIMDDSLTHEAFIQNVNTRFQVSTGDTNQVELELAEVSELKQLKTHDQFAVVFRGPLNLFMGQGMRSFEHDKLGQFELFIVPIRQDGEGFYYEAVFNRFRK